MRRSGITSGKTVAGSARQTLENFHAFGAPHVAVVTTEAQRYRLSLWIAGCFGGVFPAGGGDFGIATIPEVALAAHGRFRSGILRHSAHRNVVCGVSFGYAACRLIRSISSWTSRVDLPLEAVQARWSIDRLFEQHHDSSSCGRWLVRATGERAERRWARSPIAEAFREFRSQDMARQYRAIRCVRYTSGFRKNRQNKARSEAQ